MSARDIEGIRSRIPLRYPYLMIDRIIEEGEARVVALKNVTVNEPFFQGHFPEPLEAVMPGTLILEAMAQTAAFLAAPNPEAGEVRMMGYLVGIEKARFRRKVVPGDQLRIDARLVRRRRGLLQVDVEASVDDEAAASATVSLLLQSE
ncbi:3-hydroxyacyl-ACP dehydratase FabZ [Candidatus Bipolaricaulota bacterium]